MGPFYSYNKNARILRKTNDAQKDNNNNDE